MPRTIEDTTNWVASCLTEKRITPQVEIIRPGLIIVHRKDSKPFTAGIISTSKVEVTDVTPFITENKADIVANIPKDSVWTGAAIAALIEIPMAFGSMKDIMSATGSDEDVRNYVRKEFQFVERGLRQHSAVDTLERVNDRVYNIERLHLAPISFVMINEYELTGEHVRHARELYGDFDLILDNNPNATFTTGAISVAGSLGVEVFKWAEFLGRLNKP